MAKQTKILLLAATFLGLGVPLHSAAFADFLASAVQFFGRKDSDFANGWATLISGIFQVIAVGGAAYLAYRAQQYQIRVDERRRAQEFEDKAAVLLAFSQDVFDWTSRLEQWVDSDHGDTGIRSAFRQLTEAFETLSLIPPLHLNGLCRAFPATIAPMALLNVRLPVAARMVREVYEKSFPDNLYPTLSRGVPLPPTATQIIADLKINAEDILSAIGR